MKKDEGLIQYVLCILLLSIVSLLIIFECRARTVEMQKTTIEDAITMSALSSSLVDLNEYGKYRYIRSGSNNKWDEEEWKLLNTFKRNLKVNLNLDDNMYPNSDNGIITSQVKIVNFWVYNHEVVDNTIDSGNYNNEWSSSHRETDNYYILKYTGNQNGGYNIQNERRLITSANPILYTPKDDNIIKNSNGIDAIGGGEQPVDDMTIYATLEFDINPFGIGVENSESNFFGIKSAIGHKTIRKSVVVDVTRNYCKHNWRVLEEQIATPSENGYRVYVCDICNETKTTIEHAPTTPEIHPFPETEYNTIKKGRPMTLTAYSTDSDNDSITYEWRNRIAETSSDYPVGEHTIWCRAWDTTGAHSNWAYYTFTVKDEPAVSLGVTEKSNGNFDVQGGVNGTTLKTTFGNNGYESVVKVGNTEQSMTSKSLTLDGIVVTRKTVYDDVMNYTKTTYTVTNTTNVDKTVSIACHSDVMIGNNDSAPIYATNTGFRMTDNTYDFYVYLKNMPGVTNVDTIWFGRYSDRKSNLWNSTTATSFTGIDSGMAFSWKDRVIAPGETKNYTFIINIE